MDLAGGKFYTSGTFWDVTAIAVSIVVGIVSVWAQFRSSNPKRRLLCSMPVVTPLPNDRSGMAEDVEVRRTGQLLKFPQVVTIELVSRGRYDIRPEAFNGKPLCLDVGEPIAHPPKVTTSPSDREEPKCGHDGSKLLVGPSPIGRRQTTVFSLLVDGPSPKLSPPKQTLTDVDIRLGAKTGAERPMLVSRGIWWFIPIVPALLFSHGNLLLGTAIYAATVAVLLLVSAARAGGFRHLFRGRP